jgi:hypothetical protein
MMVRVPMQRKDKSGEWVTYYVDEHGTEFQDQFVELGTSEGEGPPPSRSFLFVHRNLLWIVVLVLVAAGLAYYHFHKSGPSASTVAAAANASSCTSTGFQLINRLDNSKTTIFDCQFDDGSEKCVTYSHGVASDSTEEVKIVFSTELGGTKPSCLP